MLKVVGYVIAGIALLGVAMIAIGALLPKNHEATVRFSMRQPPEKLYDVMVQKADSSGPMFLVEDTVRPRHFVTRIVDTSQGFGGNWSYQIAPANGGGSVVSITENGEVYNPLFRFMSRFVLGHYGSLEAYAKDLGKEFGETVTTERVK